MNRPEGLCSKIDLGFGDAGVGWPVQRCLLLEEFSHLLEHGIINREGKLDWGLDNSLGFHLAGRCWVLMARD